MLKFAKNYCICRQLGEFLMLGSGYPKELKIFNSCWFRLVRVAAWGKN